MPMMAKAIKTILVLIVCFLLLLFAIAPELMTAIVLSTISRILQYGPVAEWSMAADF